MASPKTSPLRLVRKLPGGRWQIEIDKRIKRDGAAESERVRVRKLLPPGTSEAVAVAAAARLESELVSKSLAVNASTGWADYVRNMAAGPKSWLYATAMNARNRAKNRGFECSLNADQLRIIMLRSGGRCEVTGLRFTTQNQGAARTRPYFHSIDRIDSSKGYTFDNVRVVCHAVNIAMNAWGEDVFAELARGFVFNRYSAFQVQRGE